MLEEGREKEEQLKREAEEAAQRENDNNNFSSMFRSWGLNSDSKIVDLRKRRIKRDQKGFCDFSGRIFLQELI